MDAWWFLVVEDDDAHRALVQQILGRRGHRVVAAASVDEAWQLLQSTPPAAVLLDIGVPGDGEALLHRIRQDPRLHGLPVVALTACALPEDRERFLELGFDDYLSKPFNVRALAPRVESLALLRRAG